MATPIVIPASDRSPRLKAFLAEQSKTIAKIHSERAGLIPDTASPFLYLVFPWIVSPDDAGQKAFFTERRKIFEAAGFNGKETYETLGQILGEDKHLRECCVGLVEAARCFDLFYVISAVWAIRIAPEQFNSDKHFEQFESTIYGHGKLRTISLCHLFNFQAENPSIKFGDLRVERIDGVTTSKILGETSPVSFIHPPGTGEFFVISEKVGPCDDHVKWLLEEKNRAELFLHVLQYFKDGIVHIDYAVPYFMPEWVNQVRKWGIFFIGNPRRIPYLGGKEPYLMSNVERDAIERWWNIYQKPEIFDRISDLKPSMRQAGLRAGEYFELSHTQDKPADRLISLAIALESLFSPNDKSELNFRMAQNLSQLVGNTEASRLDIFKSVKKFYAKRSNLIHGQYDVQDFLAGKWVTHQECNIWASLIRQSILRFLVIYLRGQNNRDEFLLELSDAALDAGKAETIRINSDVDGFLAEQQ